CMIMKFIFGIFLTKEPKYSLRKRINLIFSHINLNLKS
ncbi:hypothetical protein, partial [uncultured Gammaproteobacteria bacterium]